MSLKGLMYPKEEHLEDDWITVDYSIDEFMAEFSVRMWGCRKCVIGGKPLEYRKECIPHCVWLFPLLSISWLS